MSTFRILPLAVLLINISISMQGQNFIGLSKSEILKLVPTSCKGFNFVKDIQNGDKSFIKFENTSDEQTLLFMLNSKGTCTSVSRMYNAWLYDDVHKSLCGEYKQAGVDTWIDSKNGMDYEVKLKRGEWFITVTIRPMKKQAVWKHLKY